MTFTPPPFASMFSDIELGAPKSIGIYGKPGRRKTSIAGSALKVRNTDGSYRFNKMLYIDIDNGTEVFATDPELVAAKKAGRLDVIPIDKTSNDAPGMLNYLLGYRDPASGQKILGAVFDPAYGYDVIALDALDVAQEVIAAHLLATTFNDKGKLNTQAAWGHIGTWTSDLAWVFQNAPHFLGLFVTHSKEGADEGGLFSVKPKLGGSVKDSFAGIPSIVAYVDFEENPETKTEHLVGHVGKSSVMTTKNRYRIDEPIVDFDLPALFGLIDAKVAEAHGAAPAVFAPPAAGQFVVPASIPETMTAAAAA